MHSKRCYKIGNCSVILGELESFPKLQGLRIQYYLPENFRGNLRHYEIKVRIFLISLSIIFLNPNILGFLFSTKNNLYWSIAASGIGRMFVILAGYLIWKLSGQTQRGNDTQGPLPDLPQGHDNPVYDRTSMIV